MTHATLTRTDSQALRLQLSAWVFRIVQRVEDYRAYRRTVAELESLPAGMLSDLGLHKSEIKRAAADAVYGTQR